MDGLTSFVRAEGGQLWDGDERFRFFGLAAPNLHQNESQLHPDGSNRWPDEFETEDVLGTLHQMGSLATRSFGLSVWTHGEVDCHLLGPGRYSEDAFLAYDRVLAVAGRLGIRVIFPFLDSHSFPRVRGIDEFSAWRSKSGFEFWTDAQLKDDFKRLIHDVLNRRNRFTGMLYKDDPAILAWQPGNELDSYFPDRGRTWEEGLDALTPWTLEMAAFLKQEDPNHLVMEAGGRRDVYLDDPNVDLLSDHYYEYWNKLFGKPWELAPIHQQSMEHIDGRKPLIVDEFGLASLPNLRSLMQAIEDSGCVGGLLWSVRGHRRDGGFYEHNEGGTPVNSYHWPGFSTGEPYKEREVLALLRRRAFAIRGLVEPPLSVPGTPVLLSACDGLLVWQGSTGATGYRVERLSPEGRWKVLAESAEDSVVTDVPSFEAQAGDAVPPLFVDTDRGVGPLRYRVTARGGGGESLPSNELEG